MINNGSFDQIASEITICGPEYQYTNCHHNNSIEMKTSTRINEMVGWRTRFFLTCPLPVAKMAIGALATSESIHPVDWRSLEIKPPHMLALDLTEFCNSACSFCCYKTSSPRFQMSDDIFFKATEQFHDAGGRKVRLNAMTGEPLLNPTFFKKTAFLRSLGTFDQVFLTTNGILLNKGDAVESLINSGITDVEISTAGFEKATYERYMGVRRYDEFFSGLRMLLERDQESGYPVAIEIGVRGLLDVVDHDDFWTYIYPHIQASKGKVTISFLRLYLDWIGRVRKQDLPKNCGFHVKSHIRMKPCMASFLLCVRANGDLRICPNNWGAKDRSDELTIGNLNSSSLMEAWNSEITRRSRRTTYGLNCCEPCARCLWYRPISKSGGRWNLP